MTDYRAPVLDQRFVIEHVVGLDELASLPAFEHTDNETVGALLEEAARFFEGVVAPLNQVGDEQGSRVEGDGVVTPEGFADAYARYVEAGWGTLPHDPDFGGGGFPWLVALAVQEQLTAANLSFSLCPLLTQGAVDMLSAHADEEQKAIYLEKMITGEWSGTMNLSEPQAGSDVGAVRCKAAAADDGSYRITGQKIWITFGEHDMADNIVHLVLARTPEAPPGTKGISCFIVPKFLPAEDGSPGERNGVSVVSIEHKLGIHASPTCVLDYDDAVGFLIGEENAGIRYMFTMMNNARLGVGVQGMALADRARQMAVEYAKERVQGRAIGSTAPKGEASAIVEHGDVRRTLMGIRANVEAMRCVMFRNAAAIDRSHHGADELDRAAGDATAALLTPISKGWGTDLGVELTSDALQVFGGMGYVEETGVAQHWRDARIAPIYEGTNAIQGTDLVFRKLPMDGGAVVKAELTRLRGVADDLAAVDDLSDMAGPLAAAVEDLEAAAEHLGGRLAEAPRDAATVVSPFLRLFGLVEGGAELGRSAVIAHRLATEGDAIYDGDFCAAKIATARFYLTHLLPASGGLVGQVTAPGDAAFALDPDLL